MLNCPSPQIYSIKSLNPLYRYKLNLQHLQPGRRETGDRGHKTGDGRQKTGDRRRETGDRRQETRDGRQETRDKRQETGDKRQETGDEKGFSALIEKNR